MTRKEKAFLGYLAALLALAAFIMGNKAHAQTAVPWYEQRWQGPGFSDDDYWSNTHGVTPFEDVDQMGASGSNTRDTITPSKWDCGPGKHYHSGMDGQTGSTNPDGKCHWDDGDGVVTGVANPNLAKVLHKHRRRHIVAERVYSVSVWQTLCIRFQTLMNQIRQLFV